MTTLQLVGGGLDELAMCSVHLFDILATSASAASTPSTSSTSSSSSSITSSSSSTSSGSSSSIVAPGALSEKCKTLCLLEVPAFMIPRDILVFFGPVMDSIESFKVLRKLSTPGKYAALLEMRSVQAARQIMSDYNGHPLCSLEPTTCWLHAVRSVVDHSANANDVDTDADTGGATASATAGIIPDSASMVLDKAVEDLSPPPGLDLDLDPAQCPLCLAPLSEGGGSFTTCCGHSFHAMCATQLTQPQCPVCRFQHDSDSSSMSECLTCGWQDASISPHAHTHSHSTSSSTGKTESRSVTGPGGAAETEGEDSSADLWVCLICGYVGCGRSHQYHIGAHYMEHLHAYAMNVGSRQVWDFAGNGYVHRLILHKPDPGDDPEWGVGPKLTEVPDPDHSTGNQRSQRIPLSLAQQDRRVSNKLESLADNYNHVLTWQLLQHRELFEARVKMVQGFSVQGAGARKSGARSFSQAIMESLDTESDKARKQNDSARIRLNAANEELDILNNLHSTLTSNEQEWQQKVSAASLLLANMEQQARVGIPKLEKTVSTLMQRMDALDTEEKELQNEIDRRSMLRAAGTGSSSSGAGAGVKAGAKVPAVEMPLPPDESANTAKSTFRPTVTAFCVPRAPRLMCKISSDVAELDKLHELYPYIPSSNEIRPTPEVKVRKADKLAEIQAQWRNFVDFIYHNTFECPFKEGADGKRAVTQRHRAIVARDAQKHVFRPNIFPYQVTGHHYVMWYGSQQQSCTDEEISVHIAAELTTMIGSDAFDFAWYINPKMTVPEFFHVQVFWTAWAP